jgi:hypothetical protein
LSLLTAGVQLRRAASKARAAAQMLVVWSFFSVG